MRGKILPCINDAGQLRTPHNFHSSKFETAQGLQAMKHSGPRTRNLHPALRKKSHQI